MAGETKRKEKEVDIAACCATQNAPLNICASRSPARRVAASLPHFRALSLYLPFSFIDRPSVYLSEISISIAFRLGWVGLGCVGSCQPRSISKKQRLSSIHRSYLGHGIPQKKQRHTHIHTNVLKKKKKKKIIHTYIHTYPTPPLSLSHSRESSQHAFGACDA